MQELQSTDNLSSIEPGPGKIKLLRGMDVKHKVSSTEILHHKEEVTLRRQKEREKNTRSDIKNLTTEYLNTALQGE